MKLKPTAQVNTDNKQNRRDLIHERRMEVISGWQGFILVASVLDTAVSVPSTWSNCWPNPSLLHTTNLGPCPGTTVVSLALRAPVTSSLQREMELFSIVSDDNNNYWSSSFIYIFPSSKLPRGHFSACENNRFDLHQSQPASPDRWKNSYSFS